MKLLSLLSCLIITLVASSSLAETPKISEVKIGFIGSLSGFAANYGKAVLRGLELAKDEVEMEQGLNIEIIVEDDLSVTKNTVTAYRKLHAVDGVRVIIGGSWWLQSIADFANLDRVALLSCETHYDDATQISNSYFIMGGYLRPWVSVFEPVVQNLTLSSASVIRSTSGFGITLGHAMEQLFSKSGRQFLGTLEYSDLDVADAAGLAIRLKKLMPQVVYIDAHPGGLANVLRKMEELHLFKTIVFTNNIADDMIRNGLFSPTKFPNLYFTRRANPDPEFERRYRKKFNDAPEFNSDLGYYSGYLATSALLKGDPISQIKSGNLKVSGKQIRFDENNVWFEGPQQQVWHFKPEINQVEQVIK